MGKVKVNGYTHEHTANHISHAHDFNRQCKVGLVASAPA